MAGCFFPNPVACSNACASSAEPAKSSFLRPTIWTPIRKSFWVNPAGTEAAGLPVARDLPAGFHPIDASRQFHTPAISVGKGMMTSKGGN